MMEQMDLFSGIETEKQVYETLLPSLSAGLKQSNSGEDNITIDRGMSYSSVSYLKYDPYDIQKPPAKQLAFRICLRDGAHYFGVSNTYLADIPEELRERITTVKASSGFTNFDFEATSDGIKKYADFLSSVLNAVTYTVQKEFDCCSRYSQCSTEGRCIHPNPAMATSCRYRKALRDGKNYYV